MKTTFRNANGLTAFALECGYVQMVEGRDREMVDLYKATVATMFALLMLMASGKHGLVCHL